MCIRDRDLDGEPKIMLNPDDNDPNLVFPLVKPDFSKADRKSVAECIESIGTKNSKMCIRDSTTSIVRLISAYTSG